MNIELGSGTRQPSGYVCVDNNPDVNPDVLHDLKQTPLPFDNNVAECIQARHVLEHLPREHMVDVLYDCSRILKPGGELYITGPHYLNWNTPAGNHFRGFSRTSFDFVCTRHDHGGPDLFDKERVRYQYRETRRSIKLLRTVLGDEFVVQHVPNTVEEIMFTLRNME